MLKITRNIKVSGLLIAVYTFMICCNGCKKDLIEIENETELLPDLSDYAIFKGNPAHLIPNDEYKLYELSSQLFTDYALKQRLIKAPPGYALSAVDDGLFTFPDGTIIVKTFFYYQDSRDSSKGKKIIETRLLIKTNSKWSAGTYKWNDDQTDATLTTSGSNQTVNWIDHKGQANVVDYHIPGRAECSSCHNSDNSIVPIGPKVRNLNFEVLRNNQFQNQLTYLHNEGILNSVNPLSFTTLPDFNSTSYSLEERARAYLDINCAHCHNDKGFASDENLRMNYETSLEDSKINNRKDKILHEMEKKKMPKIGTTIVDAEGLALIRSFVESLR